MENHIDKILKDYTAGEADLEAANTALAEAGAGFRLEPGRNGLTEEDRKQTVVGCCPEQANGWGLLDTGTGSLERVHIQDGRLDFAVNEVQPGGATNMVAYLIICGKTYEVFGDKLGEIRERPDGKAVLKRPDMRRRMDLAGGQAEQLTARGRFLVVYDADGYAVKARRM